MSRLKRRKIQKVEKYDHIQVHLPILIDECGHEGDIEYDWGNLSAFEIVHRFWWTVCRGGFCTHGETFHREDEILWWAKGGRLYGKSPDRIRFLKELLYSLPDGGDVIFGNSGPNPNLDPNDEKAVKQKLCFQKLVESLPEYQKKGLAASVPIMIQSKDYLLRYFDRSCPCYSMVDLPENEGYDIQVIDTPHID